ncbi:hypothetical protein F4553_003478 [Allocatelliglobosispora scoriae]|uniref:Uncharacterized protein n=1 Tax=Allocatelliglobosispora scoriae TaxID=643052 RepID=A0A841BSD3_9ACTN|nr:hypothetical protein [Allocatelliglobosispora scoriae]MBB5870099.1 hypothetical protein [Allocatelliglobosispora scoriae]
MSSPDGKIAAPTSDPATERASDEQERLAARQEQDTEVSEPDPREPREPTEPFSGSEH